MKFEYSEFDKAVALQERLFNETQANRKHFDMLSEYRKWLDKNDIPAEEEGWPSSQAYQEENIKSFINEFKDKCKNNLLP